MPGPATASSTGNGGNADANANTGTDRYANAVSDVPNRDHADADTNSSSDCSESNAEVAGIETMEKKLFKSGDITPVSGNYQFVRHEQQVEGCYPRVGSYLHLRKGRKLPVHDDCQQPCVWSLMTVTNEEAEPKIQGV